MNAAGHRAIAADVHTVPAPFRTFAVRSDEPTHAGAARAPYGCVHALRADLLDTQSLAALADEGRARSQVPPFPDVDYAATDWLELAGVAPRAGGLADRIADALQATDVFGDDAPAGRRSVRGRVDYLVSAGAGFHNDVGRHWPRCLFWILALAADDVEFVMPHAGVRVPLAPADLLLFDPTMAHGLCRPRDGGLALAASFEPAEHHRQVFLTGELLLPDERWAALGSPWMPLRHHERCGALDLRVAEFDDRSGAVKRVRSLAGCMAP